MTDRTSDTGPAALRDRLSEHYVTAIDCDHDAKTDTVRCSCSVWTGTPQPSVGAAVQQWADHVLAALPVPDPAPVREALGKLPPGPYTVSWPDHQGGLFSLWGRQGTPPDFTDGWAIPLVASGVDTAINALADLLNALAAQRGRSARADDPRQWNPSYDPAIPIAGPSGDADALEALRAARTEIDRWAKTDRGVPVFYVRRMVDTIEAALRAALAARPAPSGDADAEWTKAWLRAKADVLAAINRGPDRVAVEGLLDYHGPLLRAAAPSDGAGGLDVWATDLTIQEEDRLANALRNADYVNWSAAEVAARIAGTVRAIAAARLSELREGVQ